MQSSEGISITVVCVSVFLGFRCSFHGSSSDDEKRKGKEFSISRVRCGKFYLGILSNTSDCISDRLISLQGVGKKCISVNSVNMCTCLGFKWSSFQSFLAGQTSSPNCFCQTLLLDNSLIASEFPVVTAFITRETINLSLVVLFLKQCRLNCWNRNQEIGENKIKRSIRRKVCICYLAHIFGDLGYVLMFCFQWAKLLLSIICP